MPGSAGPQLVMAGPQHDRRQEVRISAETDRAGQDGEPGRTAADAPDRGSARRRALHRALIESEDRARRTAIRLRVVADLAADLLKPHSLVELDTVLRTATRRVIEQDVFTFAVYDPAAHTLQFLAGWDGSIYEDGDIVSVTGTPSEYVIRERRSLLTLRSDDPVAAGAVLFGSGRRSESIIRSPALSGDTVLAVISVQSYEPDRYTIEDVEVLEAIASLTAAAICNIRHVAEQEAMQAALQESEARFRQLVDSIRGAFWLKDVRSGTLLYASPAFETLYGRPLAEAGRWLEFVHPEDRPAVELALSSQAAGVYDVQFRVVRPDGSVRWIRDRAFPVADEGVHRIAGIAHDITEDRQQQEQLRRAERLAAMGTMVGGVAHELNNPLQSIRGFAELMLQEQRSDADREALGLIRREAARATRIVAELRLLARRSHEAPAQHELVDLNDVVRHVLRIREYSLTTANVQVEVDLPPDLPAVFGDTSQLEQVLVNLVVNAAQAVAAVERERRLVVRTRADGDDILLTVSDNGVGIPREHLERLFDPFFTTKPPGEGTGLGLPLAQKIVAEHGGSIRVESEPDVGTTIHVALPAARPDSLAADGVTGPVPRGVAAGHADRDRPDRRRLRVLLVDDETSIRSMLQRVIERRGHVAEAAGDGAEALQRIEAARARGERYDLIISDLRMPGMGGAELASRLRADGCGDIHRLVLMTGDTTADDTALLADDPHLPLLMKPFSVHEIETLLSTWKTPG